MTHNPDYIPTGPNSKENPYYMKDNHVKLAKMDCNKEEFYGTVGGAPGDLPALVNKPPQYYLVVGLNTSPDFYGYADLLTGEFGPNRSFADTTITALRVDFFDELRVQVFNNTQPVGVDAVSVTLPLYGTHSLPWVPIQTSYVATIPGATAWFKERAGRLTTVNVVPEA